MSYLVEVLHEKKAYYMFYDILSLLRLLGLKLLPKYERQQLAKEGNTNPGKLFITWDYLTDTPLCTPLHSPEEYQKIIKDHFYA